MKYIYEIVDNTDPETYYPIGVFNDLKKAKNEILSLSAPLYNDFCFAVCNYEIRMREINVVSWSDKGVTVAKYNIIQHYNEESGYFWTVEEVNV